MTVRLRTFHLRIPGQWNDGWLYKEHIILWSRTGQMHVAELSTLLEILRNRLSPALSHAIDYAIFRNDWKNNDQFARLIEVSKLRRALFEDLPDSTGPFLVDTGPIDTKISDSDPVPGFMLDVSLYANRIYAGSSTGLFESRFDPRAPQTRKPVVQWLETEVAAVNAKNSAVNSSAGEKGLLFSHVNFQDVNWWSEKPTFKRTADISFANSFVSYHILNYADKAFPTFLRAETQRGGRIDGSKYQESRVVAYQDQADISLMASAAIDGSRRVKLSESQSLATRDGDEPFARVLGNSTSRLLVHWRDSLRVVDISAQQGKDIAARPDPKYSAGTDPAVQPSSILRTYSIESGFLVELFDEIRLITPEGSYVVASEPAARIRTFAYSRRHKDMAVVVGEESITLVGFIESPD